MRTFRVATRPDLLKMASMLEEQGHTIIFRNNKSFNAFKDGKLVRVVKVVGSTKPNRSGDEV